MASDLLDTCLECRLETQTCSLLAKKKDLLDLDTRHRDSKTYPYNFFNIDKWTMKVTNQCICPASLAPVKEGTALGIHADPGHLNPGDPDGGLGHVGHPGVVPDHVQQHSVAPLNKARWTLRSLALEVLIKWVG